MENLGFDSSSIDIEVSLDVGNIKCSVIYGRGHVGSTHLEQVED